MFLSQYFLEQMGEDRVNDNRDEVAVKARCGYVERRFERRHYPPLAIKSKERGTLLFFIQIFAGNIILRHLMRANLPLIVAVGVLHASHHVGLERVSFLD
jgi:hypothetical protein